MSRWVAIALAPLTLVGMSLGAAAHAGASPAPSSTVRPVHTAASSQLGPANGTSYRPAGCNKATATPAGGKSLVAQCFALGLTNAAGALAVSADGPPATALGPAQIQAAYNLPQTGAGMTVAVVDAGGYALAESDLAVFRDYYGLPACTTANGCFTKVDQNGGTNYPSEDSGWSVETALDLDAVSSACPACHILLVEGNTASLDDLGTAADTAAGRGVVAISNSYGVPGEDGSELSADHYYDHKGVAVTASTGDTGNVTNWPAASPDVIAVGGTTLTADSSPRGWAEAAWAGGGSGCSPYEPRPDYQTGIDTNCPDNKAIADLSADADPATGLGIYNTSGAGGWAQYGGTSLSAPLVAAMYALAGPPAAGTYPVSYPYDDPARSGDVNDVTSGSNGTCGNVLCTASPGWDGPTGLGTPNGIGALSNGPHGEIAGTVTDSVRRRPLNGVTVTATDAAGHSYSATSDEHGSYTLAAGAGTYAVTATDFGYTPITRGGVVVTTNQPVSENFALTPIPTRTLSGTVTDGSGHGWPLYAKITIAGDPRGPVYTDPAGGHYRVDLPTGATYTLHVVAAGAPGYTSQDVQVTLGNAASGVRQDVRLPVAADRCTAPGYAFDYSGIGTGFEGWSGKTPQDGWTIGDNYGQGQTWAFDDPGKHGNLTGDTGNFAIVDSGLYGYGVQSTTLTTPVVDLSGVSAPEIGFDADYVLMFNWSTLSVSLSLDGGSTWTNVWRRFSPNLNGHVDIPIPQAAGKSSVKVQFQYNGHWHGWWELDNAFVGTRSCDAVPGGLVDGVVRDANTGRGLVGATVTGAGAAATSIATPDDPKMPDGFYALFSPHTGQTSVTAGDAKYAAAHSTVRVQADDNVTRNWSLDAGHLTVKPGAITSSVTLGQADTVPVTFRNDGTASLHVDLSERDGGVTPAQHAVGHGAPLRRVKADVTTHALAGNAASSTTGPPSPADGPWTSIADHPGTTMDNVVAYNNGLAYSVAGVVDGAVSGAGNAFDPATQSWTPIAPMPDQLEAAQGTFVKGKLYVTGGWNSAGDDVASTYAYDPALDAWSKLADLPIAVSGGGAASLDGQLYVVGGCTSAACVPASAAVYSYDPAADTWTRHADYPRALSFLSCAGLAGHLVCAGGSDPETGASVADTESYDPASDTWTQVADLPYRSWGAAYAGANGRLQVVGGVANDLITNQGEQYDPSSDTWTALPNANTSVYRGGGSCGLYVVGGAGGSFQATAAAETLPHFDDCTGPTDVPWLAESPSSFDIAPGQSRTVRVRVDSSSFTQPGDASARLAITTDTPYDVQPLGVTLQVKPPRSGS